MDTPLGGNPSYIWRTILWSRNLLRKGLYWRLCTGTKISIDRDQWIPGRQPLLCRPSPLNEQDTVSTLIQNDTWNGPLICSRFTPFLAQEILTIPISKSLIEDSRFWFHDSKGKYSVRDGYKLDVGFFEPPSHCSELHSTSWWKLLWSLTIPPKVRIFWWRALHDIIPTDLLVHHVPVTGACHFCQYSYDSTCHALFWCPVTHPCWKGTLFQPLLKEVRNMGIIDVFIWMQKKLCRPDLELFPMRTWAIWQERMRVGHGENSNRDWNEVDWSVSLLNEFQAARESLHIRCEAGAPTSQERWLKPPVNQLRLDVDAAISDRSNIYSIGGVVRDHEGQLVLAFGLRTGRPLSIVFGELLALREGLRLVHDRNLEVHEVNSDSLLTVQTVAHPEEDFTYTGAIAKDVKNLLDCCNNIKLNHIRRTVNNIAHQLAFFALSSPSPFVLESGNFSIWLVNLVIDDLIYS